MPDSFTGRVLKQSWLEPGEKRRKEKKGEREKGGRGIASLCQSIQGPRARQHNLKGIDVRDPPRQDDRLLRTQRQRQGTLPVAMDTIYARGASRRYRGEPQVLRGSLSTRCKSRGWTTSRGLLAGHRHRAEARRPLAPQHRVGTVTEIYDYLTTILVSRLGQPHCPACDLPVGTQTADEIIDKIMQRPAGTRLYLMALPDVEVGDKYEALCGRDAGRRIRPRTDRRPDTCARSNAADRPAPQAPHRGGHRPRDHPARRPQSDRGQRVESWPGWPRAAACSHVTEPAG